MTLSGDQKIRRERSVASEKEGPDPGKSRVEGPGQAELSGVSGMSWASSMVAKGQRGPPWDSGFSSR